jgi:predicted secreted hydrolase
MKRRAFLTTPLLLTAGHAHAVEFAPATRGTALAFPRDHGAHPAFRTEWWYVTGWARDAAGREYGIQVTFFRNRPGLAEDNPSAFAPRQLVFAHAALADPRHGRLRHDQRAARAGFDLAGAAEGALHAWVDDWSLAAKGDAIVARVAAREFAFDLAFTPTQPVLLQGEGGWSQKGPDPASASHYYTLPHLALAGTIVTGGARIEVTGRAWLDHEWSSEGIAPSAIGWDWAGINLDDGGALMVFRMRGAQGPPVWGGGTMRSGDGRVTVFAPQDVAFTPQRMWRSPRTSVEYPVAMRMRAGTLDVELVPMMDDQEQDSRASTGTIYWEGAVRARMGGRDAGRGYLELTGYWKPLRLS